MSNQKRCLVIEDSEVIGEIAVSILEDIGLDVRRAIDPVSGIEACNDHKPEVIFLDWDLPSLGALDVLRGVAELDAETKPEIILCATENDRQQFKLAKAAGAAFHLLKPFDVDSIRDILVEARILDGEASTAGAAKAQA